MLFKKNASQEGTDAKTPAPAPARTEEQELAALEAQLEFLHQPAKQAPPVEPAPQRFPAASAPQEVIAPLRLVPGDAPSVAPTAVNTASAPQPVSLVSVAPQPPVSSGSPVAPAIEPPPSILDPAAVSHAAHGDPTSKLSQNHTPTPRPLQEVAAEQAAQTQNAKNAAKFGRQMNYRTAVVKSGGQSNSIMTSNRQEMRTPTAPIKNPLPTPKRHVSKEMDFDIQPTNAMMHFDIVDMTGIDHFDIN